MKTQDRNLIVYATIGIIALLILSQGTNLTLNLPPTQSGNGNGGDGQPPSNGQPPTQQPPTEPESDSIKPTSLFAQVSPNPLVMTHMVYGTVTSNGYKYPVTIYAKHKGANTVDSFEGLLGVDGKYEHIQQLNTPGYWEFWAKADSLTSNIAELTCQGILVAPETDRYSKTFRDYMTVEFYSHLSGNFLVVAYDHEHGTSTPLTNVSINRGGWGEIALYLDSLPNGSYEIDAIQGENKASLYGGSAWVTVGR